MRGCLGARAIPVLGLALSSLSLGACNTPTATGTTTGSVGRKAPVVVSEAERDCLGRAMYFESKRADAEGLLAVGTVVMNRAEAGPGPKGICEVVGAPRQFASGVLSKPMREQDLPKIADVADAVLAGERHPKVGRAMHFHTAGLRFPYDNMHYVAVAGGNAFYEKRKRGAETIQVASADPEMGLAPAREAAAEPVVIGPARDICRVADVKLADRRSGWASLR